MESRDTDATEGGGRGRLEPVLILAFMCVAALSVLDLSFDWGDRTNATHVLVEGALVAIGLAGSGLLALRMVSMGRDARRAAENLAREVRRLASEARQYREESRALTEGLAKTIDRQLERWSLTPAEKEVSLLVLKGLSHKEIAQARDVSEATVRQQARAIYKKAGLAGRHELAAFFLEDLLVPAHTAAQSSE